MTADARVDGLERAMLRTQDSLQLLSREMREFKQEMREFKGEMRASHERADRQMRTFQEQMAASGKESGQRRGELANKMGTLVEDIVAPGLGTIFKRVLPSDVEPDLAIRVRRRHPVDRGRVQEFDAIATGDGYALINETRNRLTPELIPEFIRMLGTAREFLPELRDRRLIGALASFYIDPSLVAAGERQGLLMLGLADGLLEILNTPGFQPREF